MPRTTSDTDTARRNGAPRQHGRATLALGSLVLGLSSCGNAASAPSGSSGAAAIGSAASAGTPTAPLGGANAAGAAGGSTPNGGAPTTAGASGANGNGAGGSGGSASSAGFAGAAAAGGNGVGGSGGSGGSASGDPCASRATCFGFEADTVGQKPAAPWNSSPDAGSVSVDTAHAHSGTQAVHVVANHGGSSAFFSMSAPFFPPAANEYYGRMLIWIDSLPKNDTHWTMLQSSGKIPGDNITGFYTYGGEGDMLIANFDSSGKSSDCWANGEDMPKQKWACVEWHFKGSANELELWIDGVADAGAHVTGKGDGCIGHDLGDVWKAPSFSNLSLGYESYGDDNDAHELWIDDVALSAQRVGCP
jgi:hypothetical protein